MTSTDPSPAHSSARAYEVRRLIEWRPAPDGNLELDDPRDGTVHRFKPWTAALFDALNAKASYRELAAHFPQAAGDRGQRELRARRFVLQLHRLGYLHVPFDAPAVLDDRFHVERELGRGAMGVAWLCRDAQTGDHAVVKTAWDFVTPIETAEEGLRAEVDALRRFDHAGIPRLRATFEREGRLHVARDFMAGQELRAHHRRPVEDAREARALVADAARLVHHVHEKGMLLLDLGPGNFLRTHGGRMSLLDVGLARQMPASGELRLGTAIGAPGFLAPELLREGIASVRSEVWALGALYAFLITGVQPPKSGDLSQILDKPDAAERTLVERLCAREPTERPPTAREAALLLDSA